MKERKFKPCSTEQLLNMLKLWCERDGWQIFTSARRTCLFNGLASAKKYQVNHCTPVYLMFQVDKCH